MEFLVRIDVDLPGDMPEPQRSDLLAAELERGLELRRSGMIQRVWRLPGGIRNVGIWEVRDATELHELIASLPLYPWLRCEVSALAQHPVEAQDRGEAQQ
jgi:muconolactone D-isomerase